ncbi:MAG: hypothetical protein M0Z53_05645 [Thermaerobacter sp.]|nr:hypothetical protein [Thermaerobacter sp.]
MMIFEHPGYVQLRDGDAIEAFDANGRKLVPGIPPHIDNPDVELGHPWLRFWHVRGPRHPHRGNRLDGLNPGADFGGCHLAAERLR